MKRDEFYYHVMLVSYLLLLIGSIIGVSYLAASTPVSSYN